MTRAISSPQAPQVSHLVRNRLPVSLPIADPKVVACIVVFMTSNFSSIHRVDMR
jgi:hypothetical protein